MKNDTFGRNSYLKGGFKVCNMQRNRNGQRAGERISIVKAQMSMMVSVNRLDPFPFIKIARVDNDLFNQDKNKPTDSLHQLDVLQDVVLSWHGKSQLRWGQNWIVYLKNDIYYKEIQKKLQAGEY